MQDAIVKILLVLLGALVGASITRYHTRRRIRCLMPVAVFQLEKAAEACASAFSITEAAAAGLALEHARQFATEVLVAEVDRKQWLEGARLVEQTRIATGRVAVEGDRAAVETTQALRDAADALRGWVTMIKQSG